MKAVCIIGTQKTFFFLFNLFHQRICDHTFGHTRTKKGVERVCGIARECLTTSFSFLSAFKLLQPLIMAFDTRGSSLMPREKKSRREKDKRAGKPERRESSNSFLSPTFLRDLSLQRPVVRICGVEQGVFVGSGYSEGRYACAKSSTREWTPGEECQKIVGWNSKREHLVHVVLFYAHIPKRQWRWSAIHSPMPRVVHFGSLQGVRAGYGRVSRAVPEPKTETVNTLVDFFFESESTIRFPPASTTLVGNAFSKRSTRTKQGPYASRQTDLTTKMAFSHALVEKKTWLRTERFKFGTSKTIQQADTRSGLYCTGHEIA